MLKRSTIKETTISIFCAGLLVAMAFAGQGEERDADGWMRGRQPAWNPTSMAKNPGLNYHALLIGVRDYQLPPSGQGWDDLGTSVQDVQALGEILSSNYGFRVSSLTDGQATRSGMLAELQKIMDLNIDDAMLVYFAGHGFYDESMDEGFWIPSDARQSEGMHIPREDWIWNSAVEKIIGCSKARHILVIADSCYAGSLFRGQPMETESQDLQWYKRVNAKPSRYLITSGDYEPVADGEGQHSLFAQAIIDYLGSSDRAIFSASDLGFAVRKRVSARTGQMVRMGPLELSSDAGGEMVFISQEIKRPADTP